MQVPKGKQDQGLTPRPAGRSVAAPSPRPYRAASARPIGAALWLLAACLLAWFLVAGESRAAMTAAPWLVLVSWIAYIMQWRPCLRVDGSGFEVVNGLRDHRIPIAAVEDVEIRQSVVIRAGGKKYVSWGAPTTPSAVASGFKHVSNLRNLPFNALPDNQRLSQPQVVGGRDEISKAWQDARAAGFPSSEGSVTSTWNWPVVAVGVGSVLWAITATLIS
jgi:hypothetical protein